jgi:putative DNA primase/helicase
MIGAMRSMTDEAITGVHRTRLTPDGVKVDRRMLGKASGAAIMLASWSSLGGGLAVAEGIETALAGWQLGWSNVWALGSVGAIASLPLLAGFASLTLLAETGDGGASQRAVDAVGSRWEAAAREVIVVTPTTGGDLNDALRGAA